jgi:peptidoglycan/xylan/chitin deacetylase (PgdA/CDA1 family)
MVALALVAAAGWLVLGGPAPQGLFASPPAEAAAAAAVPGPAPAFYTYQAPGGQGTAGQKVVALTFDDGPGPFTPQVLSVLQRYHVPATFFEIGDEVIRYPQYTQMLAAAGYPVEDHTWSHPDLTTIPVAGFVQQIDQTQNVIRSLTGRAPSCVRPPYDAFNSTVLGQIAARGLTTMSYSVDPKDYTLPGTAAIVQNVVGATFPGAVVGMHDGGGNRAQTVAALPQIITELEAKGYGFVSICGPSAARATRVHSAVYPFAGAAAPGAPVIANQPLVAAAATPSGQGYWLAASDGGVFSFGDAAFHGSVGGTRLNQPIVGMAATPSGQGYWLVAADGGIFSFGDAAFHGSMGAVPLNGPVVGLAPTHTGNGYWLVAADGGIFNFGDAAFHGSMGAVPLNQPVVGLGADAMTGGYWLVAADGGVFNFDAPFYGSRAGQNPADQFVAIAVTGGGAGYLLAGQRPAPGP